ncbi:MAG TPA: STAS domain-containing protein [Terriglobales bacterium]|nr:STAS domain-containing protein [Terriglobales bacterium]
MNLRVSTRQVDGVNIVDCNGRITLGEGSVVLRDTVKDLLAKGHKKILLNLGDVNYIDSSGIGELVSAFTTVKNQGGELKLLNLTKKVHDLLQITKLYTVFDVQDDEAAAVKAFR